MSEINKSLNNSQLKKWFILIMFIGLFIRVIDFGITPNGFNQDEAFAGYEAFSLLNYGVDSAGYHNPCYFVSWGSGMSVLQSYLAIPFIKLFGTSVIALRLPQLLLACISLPIFYLLINKIFSSNKIALIGMFLLSISPWHIMLSRWGLDANLAPSMLLIGMYFFIKGIKNNKYFIYSSIIYGMALYSYAITWVVVPLTIVVWGIYLIFTKQKIELKYIIPSGTILFIFALPLMLFLLVNKGIIPEISTSFFSVPKLLSMRNSEISLSNLFSPNSYYNLLNIFIKQNDGLIWNSSNEFGMFYKISTPFIIMGLVKITLDTIESVKKRKFCYEGIAFLGMACSMLTNLLIENININKSNSLHFYTLILLIIGIKEVFIIFKNYTIVSKTIISYFLISFVYFGCFYLGTYNSQISDYFRYGVEDAVKYVKEHSYDDIYVDSSIYYPQILFFDQTPNDVFRSTVKYTNYPSAFLDVEKFGNYTFGIDYSLLDENKTYIIKNYMKQVFIDNQYQVIDFENYCVATKK